jgi:hypothetical protein
MPFEWEEMQGATWAIFNLCMNLGLVASVIDQYPDHVQEGFKEKINQIKEWAERQMEEVQMFGEAFDEE